MTSRVYYCVCETSLVLCLCDVFPALINSLAGVLILKEMSI